MNRMFIARVVVCAALLSSCGAPPGFKPIDTTKVLFWDRQTTETADLLRQIVAEFNSGHSGLPVEAQYSGGYPEIFRKVSASIQARSLPAMAVAYQSMTTEYAQAGAVLPMEPFIADPEIGIGKDDLDDFFPVIIDTNKYPDFGNQMLSFPFCKSVLMMYFNSRVLSEAGFSDPPSTWDEFLDQCRQIRAKAGKYAYAVSVDASTIDGMIFSMGGEILEGRQTRFDSPEALRVFKLFETLAKEELAYQIPADSYDDRDAFAQDRVAFIFRSSSHRSPIDRIMEGNRERWGMARIPQGDASHPKAVLYGPNICIFKTTSEQQRRSWEFVKHFTSREVNVNWALGTGYVPIRKSAAENPHMQAFWSEWKYNRAAFDCLPFAMAEPNLGGWQEVRERIEKAQAAVLAGKQSAEEAARELKKNADEILRNYAP